MYVTNFVKLVMNCQLLWLQDILTSLETHAKLITRLGTYMYLCLANGYKMSKISYMHVHVYITHQLLCEVSYTV